MGELVECSCDKNLVRHNVLVNNNQMVTVNHSKNINTNRNKTKKPRNGHKKILRTSNNKGHKHSALLAKEPIVGENWEWSGCDDNANFGNRKSKDFLDARFRKRSDIKTLVRIHNNDAGRLVSYFFLNMSSYVFRLLYALYKGLTVVNLLRIYLIEKCYGKKG